jgi:hypothetical protein
MLEQGQYKRGWKESDIEDCARIIVSCAKEESFYGEINLHPFLLFLVMTKAMLILS